MFDNVTQTCILYHTNLNEVYMSYQLHEPFWTNFFFHEYRIFQSANYYAFVIFDTLDVINFLNLLIKLNLLEKMIFLRYHLTTLL